MVVYGRMSTAEFKGRVVEVPYGYHTATPPPHWFLPPPTAILGRFLISEILQPCPRNARCLQFITRHATVELRNEAIMCHFVYSQAPDSFRVSNTLPKVKTLVPLIEVRRQLLLHLFFFLVRPSLPFNHRNRSTKITLQLSQTHQLQAYLASAQ